MYLEFVPEDLNPADSLSRVDSEWKGKVREASAGASHRHVAVQSFPRVPSPVWVFGCPKGRRGAAHNLDEVAPGSAEPQA